MRKTIYSIAVLSSVLFPAVTFPLAAVAQFIPGQENLGICGVHRLTGRSVVTSTGEVVDMLDYCRRQQVLFSAISEEASEETSEFWDQFLTVASPRALEFAQSIGRQAVIDYGVTVCPYLEDGGSLQELRQIQADREIPSAFDVAVTVAAIHTYCPQYVSQIGRAG